MSGTTDLPAASEAGGEKAPAGGWSRRRFMTAAGIATGALAGTGALGAPSSALADTTARTAPARAAAASAQSGTTLAQSYLAATHNSYSGNAVGAKGSIKDQLEAGIRYLELDIHSAEYAATGDFQIGESGGPGEQVDHSGGNPSTNALSDWTAIVANWSQAHPGAAPIIVMFDLKDTLASQTSYAHGNLGALNASLTRAFGKQLYPAEQALGPNALGATPVEDLRGKVLTLLSGDPTSRAAYLRDRGADPAVAMNSAGQVVEVHTTATGQLHYWTGLYQNNGTVTWQRTGISGSNAMTPAVALDDNGNVVLIYSTPASYKLYYQAGTLDSGTGEITWTAAATGFDTGVVPTIAFTGDNTLTEIHRSQSTDLSWVWTGTLNPATGSVAWDPATHGTTGQSQYDKATASQGTRSITVWSAWDAPFDPQTVVYTTAHQKQPRPVRLPQVAFDEYQAGNSQFLAANAPFYAATATNTSFITASRTAGHLTRGWDFDSASLLTKPPANFLATNYPYQSWYTTLMQQLGAIQ